MKQTKLQAALLVLLILAAMTFGLADAQALEPKIPNPSREFYSNDFADILDSDTERDIVSMGESTFKAKEGGQVVFVSMDSLDGAAIEEYANTLFNKWGIGTKDKGVLFILSMQERRSRIEVGYGYEGVLTDLESNKLLKKFSQLNEEVGIDGAVKIIYSDICSIVTGDGDSVQYPETREAVDQGDAGSSFVKEHPILTAVMVIIILILVVLDFILTGGQVTFFILRMAAAASRRGGGGGRNSGGGGRSGGGGSSSGF